MSDEPISPLYPGVLEKLRAAFGEPTRVVEKDRHWALRRLSYVSAINILLDGGNDFPVIWVFDPHDPSNGVSHQAIREASQVEGLILNIQARVKRGGEPLKHG